MPNTLIVYSTVDGHTLTICQRIANRLQELGQSVTLTAVERCDAKALQQADSILVGASIRYGKHRPSVYRLTREHRRLLESKPNAFFTVNVVARKPNRNTPDSNPYLKKFLKQIDWQPQLLGVFAGRIDYRRYRWYDRLMIRLIMKITKGPTDPATDATFTDWDAVDRFAQKFHQRVQTGSGT